MTQSLKNVMAKSLQPGDVIRVHTSRGYTTLDYTVERVAVGDKKVTVWTRGAGRVLVRRVFDVTGLRGQALKVVES